MRSRARISKTWKSIRCSLLPARAAGRSCPDTAGLISNRRDIRSDCGVVLIEFALVAGLFFFFILGIIDIARYYSVRTIATKAAQNMLDLAETAPKFDIDLRTVDSGSTEYAEYKTARQAIMSAGQNILYQVASPSSTSGAMVQLTGFRPYDVLSDGTVTPFGSNTDVVILRPGDGARNHSGSAYIEHPAICAIGSTCSTHAAFAQRTVSDADSMYSLLSDHPILVRIDIEYRPISPWLWAFGTIPITIQMSGYRELPPETSPGEKSMPPTTTVPTTTTSLTTTTSVPTTVTTSTSSVSTTSVSSTSTSSTSVSSTSTSTTSIMGSSSTSIPTTSVTTVSTTSLSTTSTTSTSSTSTISSTSSSTTSSSTTSTISCDEDQGDDECGAMGKCWHDCKCVTCGAGGN